MVNRLTYEFVKSEFEKEGYVLMSDKYINANTKLNYICPNGHAHLIDWAHWYKKSRCRFCDIERRASKQRLDFNIIIKSFKNEKYVLLTNAINYKNTHQKLNYICPNGHNHSVSWQGWCRGYRCSYCSGNIKLNINFIKSEFEKENYKLLSDEYKNNKQKLDYICSNNHRHNTTYANWVSGNRCPYCSGKIIPTFDFIKSSFEVEGYELLSTKCKKSAAKLLYICQKGHKNSTTWDRWRSGKRCPTCANINKLGSGNVNWRGGISCEPYCDVWLDKDFKESIKERDNYECQNPDCWRTSNILIVHHIDYNKKNCHPRNLITLCNSCNARANKNRSINTTMYQRIINKKYEEQ